MGTAVITKSLYQRNVTQVTLLNIGGKILNKMFEQIHNWLKNKIKKQPYNTINLGSFQVFRAESTFKKQVSATNEESHRITSTGHNTINRIHCLEFMRKTLSKLPTKMEP